MAKAYFKAQDCDSNVYQLMSAFASFGDDLVEALNQVPRSFPKCMVIDDSLVKPIDRMLKLSDLEEYNIKKIFTFGSELSIEWKYIVYVIRPNMSTTKEVINKIKADRNNNYERNYYIAYVPKSTVAMETLLENEGYFGHNVCVLDFEMTTIPLDIDLVTMNCPELFRNVFLENDYEHLELFGRALSRLLSKFGMSWKDVISKLILGDASRKIKCLFDSNVIKSDDSESSAFASDLAKNSTVSIVLMDRDIDYVTPLMTQLVYEGRLDDHFEIELGKVTLDPEVTDEEKPRTLYLDWKDKIFANCRLMDPAACMDEIRSKLNENRAKRSEGRSLKSVEKMHNFVTQEMKDLLTQSDSLERHMNILTYIGRDQPEQVRVVHLERQLLEGDCSNLQEYLEEQLSLREGFWSSLRLMCLWSVVNNGIPEPVHDSLVQLACQSYGYESIFAFYNLKRAGLLYPREATNPKEAFTKKEDSKLCRPKPYFPTSSFASIQRYLELKQTPQTAAQPDRPKDVFLGNHSPIVSRLVEKMIIRPSATPKDDWLKGAGFIHTDFTPPTRSKARNLIIVGFVGGCTYSEVNALRILTKKSSSNIVILTSCIFNSCGLIKQLEKL